MKKLLFLAVAASCATLTPILSRAQFLVNENFDGYADQAAFVAAWPAVGATPSGALQGTNYVSPSRGVYYGLTAMRNERSFTESGLVSSTTAIKFSFDFFDYSAAATPYRQYANLQDGVSPGSSGQLISIGLNNNQTASANGGNFFMARILGYTPTDTGASSGSYFKLNDNPLLLRTTGWHNLAVTISDVDLKFYVDGSLAKTVANTFTLRSYDVVRLGSGLTSTTEAAFDNVRIELIQVPEPGVISLAMLGGVALLARRQLRR
mgnify:CR=1 FL=1